MFKQTKEASILEVRVWRCWC